MNPDYMPDQENIFFGALEGVANIEFQDREFTLIPSPLDARDHSIEMYYGTNPVEFPENYEGIDAAIYDQLNTYMCVGFAIACAKEDMEFVERGYRQRYSPAYIYSHRFTGNNMMEGMIIRNALMDLKRVGICPHELFPEMGHINQLKPIYEARKANLDAVAFPQVIKGFAKLKSIEDIKRAIMETGTVICGYMIYSSFSKMVNGVVPMPALGEKPLGGHCMRFTGWKMINGKLHWKTPNSAGKTWGDKGYCYIPHDYPGFLEAWMITDATPIVNNSREVYITVGSDKMVVSENNMNHKEIPIDTPAMLFNNRTMVPVGLVATVLGAEVSWDQQSKTAKIVMKTL